MAATRQTTQDECRSSGSIVSDIIRQALGQATEYMKFASAIYETEEKRQAVLTPLLCDILDIRHTNDSKRG